MIQASKAVACVVQESCLLCFKHPHAGWQIPKGTVEVGEDPAQAAVRELHEESGIAFVGDVVPLGSFDRTVGGGPKEQGPLELHTWHMLLMRAEHLPPSWRHVAQGSVAESGLVFEYFWHPLFSSKDGFIDVYTKVIDNVEATVAARG